MGQATALALVEEESFLETVAAWTDWLTYRDLSPNTIRLYTRTIQGAHQDLGDLRALPDTALDGWLQTKGGKAGTVGNRICALTSFYRFLTKTKRRADNPALELERPKQHKRLPKPVKNISVVLEALVEADRLANVAGAIPRRVGETKDMAIVLMRTGLRIHEAVKFDAPLPCPEEWSIIGKGNKEEIIQLDDEVRAAWERLEGRWPVGARATQRRFEKVAHVERVTPHMWRHTLATLLVREGVEIGRVSKIMRHENPATTMVYAAYDKRQNRQALSVLDDALASPRESVG